MKIIGLWMVRHWRRLLLLLWYLLLLLLLHHLRVHILIVSICRINCKIKIQSNSSNLRLTFCKKNGTYRDFVAVAAASLHEKIEFAVGNSGASSADSQEAQHHPRVLPQVPRGRGGRKGCSTFEQKFLFIMILLLLRSVLR